MQTRECVLSPRTEPNLVVGRVIEGFVGATDDRYLPNSAVGQYPTAKLLFLSGNKVESGKVLSRRSTAVKGVALNGIDPEKLLQFVMQEKAKLEERRSEFFTLIDAADNAYWAEVAKIDEAAAAVDLTPIPMGTGGGVQEAKKATAVAELVLDGKVDELVALCTEIADDAAGRLKPSFFGLNAKNRAWLRAL